MAHTLLIVGGGKMGSALLGGLLTSGWVTPEQVAVSETSAERREELEQEFPGVRVIDAPEAPVSANANADAAPPAPPPPPTPPLPPPAPGRSSPSSPTRPKERAGSSGPSG